MAKKKTLRKHEVKAELTNFELAKAKYFNLNLPRYIDSTTPEDLQDIEAHLRGGIPERDLDALDAYRARAGCFSSAGSTCGRGARPATRITALTNGWCRWIPRAAR